MDNIIHNRYTCNIKKLSVHCTDNLLVLIINMIHVPGIPYGRKIKNSLQHIMHKKS